MRESTRFEIDVPALLRALRKARGWNQEVLADQLETSQSAISRWEAGTSVPNGEAMLHIRALAEEAGLVGPHQPIRHGPSVPIVGRVGAGAVVEPEFEQLDPLDEIEIPFTFPDPVIAFEIAGDSMLPVYQDREIIVCLRDQVRPTESYLGRRAVVRTTRGPRYLKELARGSRRGWYNLMSWNASPIVDVKIDWLGEIVAAVPGDAARRLRRSG